MKKDLKTKKVAVLAADGFEQSEFEVPITKLKEANAKVDVISLKKGKIKSWNKINWGAEFEVNKSIEEIKTNNYDALVLPGGVMNPDALRMNKKVIQFVDSFMIQGKPVAAICHGPWTLIETGKLVGKKVTSYPSLRSDLINAGAQWVNKEVVVDNNLITSRTPEDLPAFCQKIIEELAETVFVN